MKDQDEDSKDKLSELRQRAEEGSREKSRLNQILIDRMPCVALLLRSHSREIVASNEQAVKVGAVPGAQCFTTWGQREDPCPWCLAPKLWGTGEAQHLEVEALGIVFDAYWIPISSDLYMHYAFDITDRKRSEDELRESERKYKELVDNANSAIIRWSRDGTIKFFNEYAQTLFGYTADEVIGRHVNILVPEKDSTGSDLSTLVQDIVNHPDRYVKTANENICRDGRRVWMTWTNKPILDDEGQVVEILAVGSDITELQRAEKERDRILNLSRDLICVAGTDGYFKYVNPAWENVLGYTRESLLSKPFLEFIHPEDHQKNDEEVARLASGKATADFENRYIHREGSIRTISWKANPLAEKGLMYCVGRDVTDRRIVEEALRESENRFKSMFLKHDAIMFLIEPETGRIVDANLSAQRFYGYEGSELLQMSIQQINTLSPDEVDLERQRALREERNYFVFSHRLASGELRTVEVHSSPVDLERQTLLFSIIHDITERKKAEEILRRASAYNRTLIETSLDPLVTISPDGRISDVNTSTERVTGCSRDELIGTDFSDYFTEPERARAGYQQVFKESLVQDYELEIRHRNGHVTPVTYSASVYRDESGEVVGVFAAARDITERKRSEELALQSARLRAVADLSSGVAHHFNNLLQIVMASTSLSLADLESGDLSEIKSNLEKMLQAATLGAETVKRLQAFANVRADVTESESGVFDLATTVRNAAEVSKPLWKPDSEKKGIKIDLQFELEDGCLVKGQENEMFEVLVNLIRNAAEALPDGGDIEVKAFNQVDEVVITIRDTGTGIAEEDLSRVFQPFWSSKGVGIGKGMGLAVTHGLVKRHGGTISVDSKVGVGTTFTIRLPLAHELVTKTDQPSMSTSGDRLIILVIDDDVNIASLLERICAKEGHRVFKAHSGQEGLAIFNKEPMDLVISDLGMPGMSGWDVGKAIRSTCQERNITKPPFILLTGWGGRELEKEKIIESGVDAVVAKPIDRATVLATVQEIAVRFH